MFTNLNNKEYPPPLFAHLLRRQRRTPPKARAAVPKKSSPQSSEKSLTIEAWEPGMRALEKRERLLLSCFRLVFSFISVDDCCSPSFAWLVSSCFMNHRSQTQSRFM